MGSTNSGSGVRHRARASSRSSSCAPPFFAPPALEAFDFLREPVLTEGAIFRPAWASATLFLRASIRLMIFGSSGCGGLDDLLALDLQPDELAQVLDVLVLVLAEKSNSSMREAWINVCARVISSLESLLLLGHLLVEEADRLLIFLLG